MPADEEPTLADVLKAFRESVESVADGFTAALEDLQEETQYRFDKELGKQLSKHPELYAELKRGYRKMRKGLDQAAKDMGLR